MRLYVVIGVLMCVLFCCGMVLGQDEEVLSAVSFEGMYDGAVHEGGAAGLQDWALISYSVDGGETWTDVRPGLKDAGRLDYMVRAVRWEQEWMYAEGSLVVTPREVEVRITGHTDSVPYDGKRHSVSGYDVEVSDPLYGEGDFVFTGKADAARVPMGVTYMGLSAEDFSNTNGNFDVTFDVTDGYQRISSLDEVVVRITGNRGSAYYNGQEHGVSGYEVSINNPLYSEASIGFSGRAEAKRIRVGTSYMGLSADDFTNLNPKFSDVVFVVTDGFQEILPLPEILVEGMITSETVNRGAYAPPDLVSENLKLQALIRNHAESHFSEVLNVDTRMLTVKQSMPVRFLFLEAMPSLTSGEYTVEIYGIPEFVEGTDVPMDVEDQSLRNKYYVRCDSWINEAGVVEIRLTWTPETVFEEPGDLLEDAVGMYVINEAGEKEYSTFRSYEVCMSYMGDPDLCEGY